MVLKWFGGSKESTIEELIARKKYARAVELQPDDPQPFLLLANIYTSKKRYDDAVTAYRKVIAINPQQEDPYLYLGSLYASLKRYDEAVETFHALDKINPALIMTPYYLGRRRRH